MLVQRALVTVFAVAGNAAEARFVSCRIENVAVERILVAEVPVAWGAVETGVVHRRILEVLVERALICEFPVAGGAVEARAAFTGGGSRRRFGHGLASVAVQAVLG